MLPSIGNERNHTNRYFSSRSEDRADQMMSDTTWHWIISVYTLLTPRPDYVTKTNIFESVSKDRLVALFERK